MGATPTAAGVKGGLLGWGARHQDKVRDQGPFLEVGEAGLLWLRRNRGTLQRALRCHTGRAGRRARTRRAGLGHEGLRQARARTGGSESREPPWHGEGVSPADPQKQAGPEVCRPQPRLAEWTHLGACGAGRLTELQGQGHTWVASTPGGRRPGCPGGPALQGAPSTGSSPRETHSTARARAQPCCEPPVPPTCRPSTAGCGPHRGSAAAGVSQRLP